MAIFENINPFNKDANFSSIRIGADAPVLEVELNEMQLIQRERLRSTTKALINEGVKGTGSYSYRDNLLTITNELVMLDGEVLNIPHATLSVREGEEVYVEVWEEEKTFLDDIFKHGSSHTTEKIPNYLLDGRIGEETSRRIQVRYRVTTTPTKETKLLLGYVEHNNFILLANNLNAKITPYGNGMDFTVYQHFTLVSPLGKKFKLKSTYEGELYTEPSTDTFIGLPVILEDPNNRTWMIVVDEEGRLSTVRTSKPTLNVHHYLQTPPPFGIIYKLEVTVEGELRVASVCEVNIINDEVTTLDKTWSSHKLNQHVLAQDKVVKDLAAEQTEFLQEVIRQKDELIETLVNEKNTLIQELYNEKEQILTDLEVENARLIKYTEAKINELVSLYTVINSPNGTLFQVTVDDEGVLGTIQKEVIVKND